MAGGCVQVGSGEQKCLEWESWSQTEWAVLLGQRESWKGDPGSSNPRSGAGGWENKAIGELCPPFPSLSSLTGDKFASRLAGVTS